MAGLEERILENTELQPHVWWRYIDNIFLMGKHGEDFLEQFIETLKVGCTPSKNILYLLQW